MLRDLHLTKEGFRQIVAIKAAMNRGLSDVLKEAFPYVVPITRLKSSTNKKIYSAYWLAGFTSAEGCFMVNLNANKNHKLGGYVKLELQVSKHFIDKQFMKSLIKYLNGGNIYEKKK